VFAALSTGHMKKLASFFIFFFIQFVSCDSDELSPTPTIESDAPTNITNVSASVGGIVRSAGQGTVTERGVYYGTAPSPETTGQKIISAGVSTGEYSVDLKGLDPNTKYFVKAYVFTSISDAVGNEESFTTLTTESGTFTDSRDGAEYPWTKIGAQVWMARNLSFLPAVSPSATASSTNQHFYVYGYAGTNVTEAKATENYQQYGVLYNWSGAMNGAAASNVSPSGVRGVCPSGWHLPSEVEMETLIENVGGVNVGGTKLKSTSGWNANNGADLFGFNALPAGDVAYSGFRDKGEYTAWWNSRVQDTFDASHMAIGAYSNDVVTNTNSKDTGLSVRCVRD
jgi:uncharacterized protein (TIGR02145 family)